MPSASLFRRVIATKWAQSQHLTPGPALACPAQLHNVTKSSDDARHLTKRPTTPSSLKKANTSIIVMLNLFQYLSPPKQR